MKSINHRLNAVLKKGRIEANISQYDLGEHLNYKSGAMFISNWENDKCGPPLERLPDIVSFLKIEEHKIFRAYINDRTEEYEMLNIRGAILNRFLGAK